MSPDPIGIHMPRPGSVGYEGSHEGTGGGGVTTGAGTGVGTGVGTAVGTGVGTRVGTGVGTGVGTAVGRAVGLAVGSGVGVATRVGSTVGSAVGVASDVACVVSGGAQSPSGEPAPPPDAAATVEKWQLDADTAALVASAFDAPPPMTDRVALQRIKHDRKALRKAFDAGGVTAGEFVSRACNPRCATKSGSGRSCSL